MVWSSASLYIRDSGHASKKNKCNNSSTPLLQARVPHETSLAPCRAMRGKRLGQKHTAHRKQNSTQTLNNGNRLARTLSCPRANHEEVDLRLAPNNKNQCNVIRFSFHFPSLAPPVHNWFKFRTHMEIVGDPSRLENIQNMILTYTKSDHRQRH